MSSLPQAYACHPGKLPVVLRDAPPGRPYRPDHLGEAHETPPGPADTTHFGVEEQLGAFMTTEDYVMIFVYAAVAGSMIYAIYRVNRED